MVDDGWTGWWDVRALAVLGLGVVACSSSDSDKLYTFRDSAGRVCQIVQFEQEATCDAQPAPPQACAADQRACFYTRISEPVDGVAGSPTLIELCDSCCKLNESGRVEGSTSSSCADFLCTTAADCGGYNAACRDGRCVVSSG